MKNMVRSVRESIGVGMLYEIVLVDGGSTDGTIEWCKAQSDVVLVEQGALLGAVEAFNAGFGKASGEYVIAANDDIKFVDESILCAIRYMQDNPDVGCGCFWQDRGGKSWHIEYMPAILDGKQISHVYGQVAIYPRWLGDKVGWWGDYLHTYGGDNELSCHILELGYKIRAVPCACIHDSQVYDELRKINNEIYHNPSHVARKGRPHNDSLTWGLHWQHKGAAYKGMTGPIVKVDGVAISNSLDRRLRILYMPIYEPGHPVQKGSKRGLREALSHVGLVYEYDYMDMCQAKGKKFGVDHTFDLANIWKPNLFVFQVQGTEEYTAPIMAGLRAEHPSAVFVNWNGDYHPDVLHSQQYMDLLKQFHLTGLVTTSVVEKYTQVGVPWFYWQIGYEESDAGPLHDTPKHDVVFLANGYSEVRYKLARQLRKLKCDVGIYGAWPPEYKPNGSTLYDFDAGQRLYRAAKFAISDNQWKRATGFVSNRLFQAMAAGGAMFLQQHFDGLKLLGLRDGEHLVVWQDFHDLQDKIHYYMAHEDERKAIADVGTVEILENHSFDVRVMELLDELRVRGLWPLYP